MQVSDQDQVWTAVAQHLRDQLTEGSGTPRSRTSCPSRPTATTWPSACPATTSATASSPATCPSSPKRSTTSSRRGARWTSSSPAESVGRRRPPTSRRRSGPRPRLATRLATGSRRLERARRRRAQPPLHVRDVRQGRLQPVRPGRRPARRRDPGALVQPAVHLRRGRPRQDPPAARHRPLRPPQLPAPRGALRLHRDVPQRVRRRHPHQHRQRRSSAATATSTSC